MRTLITGATGFIGSRLALRCLRDDHAVRVLGQNRNSVEARNLAMLAERGAETVVASVADKDALASAHRDVEVVFHLAAAQHEANVPDRHFWEVNVEGTRNMLSASVEAGVKRFVHGSTIGVYGFGPDGTVHDDSETQPDNIYGVTKLEGEKVVRSFGDRLEWVIVRISEVYGPGDYRLLKMFRGLRKGTFPMIGLGKNLHHLVYIDDLLDGLLASASAAGAVGKTYVLAGPRPVSTKEMATVISMELGAKPPRIRVPMGPALAIATLTESVLRPFGIQPPLHPRRMNFYRKSFSFLMEEAREAIDFRPSVELPAGVRKTARWYVDQDLL